MSTDPQADKVSFDIGRLRLSIESAVHATNQAMHQLADLRLIDRFGLDGIEGLDAGLALESALSSLRSARRIAKLREIATED